MVTGKLALDMGHNDVYQIDVVFMMIFQASSAEVTVLRALRRALFSPG